MATCTFCGEEILAGAPRCTLCLKEAPVVRMASSTAVSGPVAITIPGPAPSLAEEDVYELPAGPTEIPAEWQRGAVYELELPARCPYCQKAILTLRVLRLKRTQVTFTSTLPRGGRAIACPECDRILSAELTAL